MCFDHIRQSSQVSVRIVCLLWTFFKCLHIISIQQRCDFPYLFKLFLYLHGALYNRSPDCILDFLHGCIHGINGQHLAPPRRHPVLGHFALYESPASCWESGQRFAEGKWGERRWGDYKRATRLQKSRNMLAAAMAYVLLFPLDTNPNASGWQHCNVDCEFLCSKSKCHREAVQPEVKLALASQQATCHWWTLQNDKTDGTFVLYSPACSFTRLFYSLGEQTDNLYKWPPT